MMTLNDRAHDGKINGSFSMEQEKGRNIYLLEAKRLKKMWSSEGMEIDFRKNPSKRTSPLISMFLPSFPFPLAR